MHLRDGTVEFVLVDRFDSTKSVCGTLSMDMGSLIIKIDGYGTDGMKEGEGWPVEIELEGDSVCAIIWPDINADDPQIIDLERAKEIHRGAADGS